MTKNNLKNREKSNYFHQSQFGFFFQVTFTEQDKLIFNIGNKDTDLLNLHYPVELCDGNVQ